jgi:predicted RND superfamily exporter protein
MESNIGLRGRNIVRIFRAEAKRQRNYKKKKKNLQDNIDKVNYVAENFSPIDLIFLTSYLENTRL